MTPRSDASRARSTRPDRALAVVVLVVVLLALASCAARKRRTPDDAVVMLIESPVNTTDPRYTLSNYETKVSRLVAQGLIHTDTPDMSPAMALAERIDRIDDVTYEATLKPGLLFSDGQPVTAEDVAWTFESVIASGSDSVYKKQYQERFTSIEVLDARRVRFHLVAPLATFITDLDFGILAKHAADKDGKFPGGRVVGAGPYRVVSRSTDVVELAANPHYHGTRPGVPRVVIKVVRDASARMVMLVGGSADLIQNAVRLDLVDDVAARPRVAVSVGPSSILTYVMMNNEHPILDDVRVRQAIALAIDREAIIDAKYAGRAVMATGLLAPGHWAYEPDVPRYGHDLARAKALLDDAGFPDPDGDGPRPRFSLIYKTSTDQFRVSISRVIASQLGDIGIAVEVRAFEFGTFLADIKKGSFEIASMQTTDIGEPDFYRTYFSSKRIPGVAGGDPNGLNRWRYRNDRIDELTEQGRRELDLGKRKALYSEAQKIIARDVPIIALWHEHNVVLTNQTVVGYTILPNARFGGLVDVHKN